MPKYAFQHPTTGQWHYPLPDDSGWTTDPNRAKPGHQAGGQMTLPRGAVPASQAPTRLPYVQGPLNPFSTPTRGGGSNFGFNSPTQPTTPGGGGGNALGINGLSWSDLLALLGAGVSAYTTYRQGEQGRDQQGEQFDKTYQLQSEQMQRNAAIQAADRINRAPMADRAQYLAMNQAAPTPFQPRDYTRGLSQIRGNATGGAAAQLAANAEAASKYEPGAGGVNSDVYRMILSKMGYPEAAVSRAPQTPSAAAQPAPLPAPTGAVQPFEPYQPTAIPRRRPMLTPY